MVDEVRLAVVVAIITIAIPVFIITSEAKSQLSSFHLPVPLSAAAMSGGNQSSMEHPAKSNPEQALYSMYDTQAAAELDRCFGSEQKELCDGTVDLIVDSCTNSQVDLAVCHDPRIEQLIAKA